MSIHRVRSTNPGGSGVSSAASPTFTAPETEQRSSALTPSLLLPDGASRGDRVAATVLQHSGCQYADAYRLPTVSFAAPDSRQSSTVGTFTVTETAVGRSGSPDSDRWGDGWTDSTVGQTGVNYGNATLCPVINTGVVEQRAWMEIDLQKYVGLTAVSGTFTTIWGTGEAMLSRNITVGFKPNSTTRPFTESTLTWSNQPALATTITKTFAVPGGSSGLSRAVSLSASELAQLLGQWVLISFSTGVSVSVSTMYTPSREGGSDRPVLSFTATR